MYVYTHTQDRIFQHSLNNMMIILSLDKNSWLTFKYILWGLAIGSLKSKDTRPWVPTLSTRDLKLHKRWMMLQIRESILQIRESANQLLWSCIIFLKWKKSRSLCQIDLKDNLCLRFLELQFIIWYKIKLLAYNKML